jgi:2-methylcitrate dehydratase PrpD
VANAAVAGRLLGLSQAQVVESFGIADYLAPFVPMMRDIADPGMVKHGMGWGAMTGVMAAELAQHGFTGTRSLLGFEKYAEWVSSIGNPYLSGDGVGYKSLASCAWGHAACRAAHETIQKHRINVADIAHITVRTFQEAIDLYQQYPQTTEQAQFSTKWPIAVVLLDGEIGPRQMLEARLADPQARALFDKIELVPDPEMNELYAIHIKTDNRMYSAVEIQLADGRTFDSGLVERGAQEFDEAVLEQKFRKVAGSVLEPGLVDELVPMIWHFEDVPAVGDLTRRLR